jgi:4-phospho-D-threonate 3-dehydrogenase / 4-phospho-D-erythronate 3-dehydrogenase
MGDPSGIGPEVTVKAMASLRGSKLADFFVVGDRAVIDRLRKRLGIRYEIPVVDVPNLPAKHFSYGKESSRMGRASMDYIDTALWLIKSGAASALVTGPVNKASIHKAGFSDFTGHTEYLASRTGTKDFAMVFVGGDMKIALVTRHVALKDVPKALTAKKISTAVKLTDKYLKEWFNIKHPRIAVAGLNPHAGEGGLFGDEEERVIIPAMKSLSRRIKGLSGPYPPDAVFYHLLRKKFDVVIAMYHDQALIPFKMLYFDTGVNLTLGLPFVRTSPDHGTAFDIAGKMKANPASMIDAMKLAARLASKR